MVRMLPGYCQGLKENDGQWYTTWSESLQSLAGYVHRPLRGARLSTARRGLTESTVEDGKEIRLGHELIRTR